MNSNKNAYIFHTEHTYIYESLTSIFTEAHDMIRFRLSNFIILNLYIFMYLFRFVCNAACACAPFHALYTIISKWILIVFSFLSYTYISLLYIFSSFWFDWNILKSIKARLLTVNCIQKGAILTSAHNPFIDMLWQIAKKYNQH